jgi:hypothetical protein
LGLVFASALSFGWNAFYLILIGLANLSVSGKQKPEMHQCVRFDLEGISSTPDIRHL